MLNWNILSNVLSYYLIKYIIYPITSNLIVISSLLALVHNEHLNTEARALRSGKSTKQNAHNRVLALVIQSLMNTTFVLMRKKKLYKGVLEPGTSKCFDKSAITRLSKNTNIFKCIYLFTAVKTLSNNYIVLLIFL